MSENIGQFERESLEKRRDELYRKHERLGLEAWEGKELDMLIAQVGCGNRYPVRLTNTTKASS